MPQLLAGMRIRPARSTPEAKSTSPAAASPALPAHDRLARVFHRRKLIGNLIKRCISIGKRSDDLFDRDKIIVTRVHPDLLRRLAQISKAGLLEHDSILGRESKSVDLSSSRNLSFGG